VFLVPFEFCSLLISLASSPSFSSVLNLVRQLGWLSDGNATTWEGAKLLWRELRMLGWFRGFDASCAIVRLEEKQLGVALMRPQLGQGVRLACGWQRLNLRERKTRQERLCRI
jgi:hypothetical protein